MKGAIVLDARGNQISNTTEERAEKLVVQGKATRIAESPLTIQLAQIIDIPTPETLPGPQRFEGQSILLHICCGPCSTYTVARLREQGWDVSGYWYNPNVHPFSEHERRRGTLAQYATEIELPVIWEPGYEMPEFLRQVANKEEFGKRCMICYHMRLERTAARAAELGMDAFSTTLLISPYQNQKALRQMGEELAKKYGVTWYWENFRRGFAEHHRLAHQSNLYMQRYCGCIYSEWEALDSTAWTNPRRSRGDSI